MLLYRGRRGVEYVRELLNYTAVVIIINDFVPVATTYIIRTSYVYAEIIYANYSFRTTEYIIILFYYNIASIAAAARGAIEM